MGANSSSFEGIINNREEPEKPFYLEMMAAADRNIQREETPFRLLTVRIMRARNIQKADILTESDCYVSLSLPTSTSEVVKTDTIPNSKNPEWNQAFTYRIDSRIKNTLHLKLCDEDTYTKDDHLYTVLFDVGKLRTGQMTRVSFKLNPETEEELDVEFKLQSMIQRPRSRPVVNAVRNRETPRDGILALGSRWISWLRSIDIPKPPGF